MTPPPPEEILIRADRDAVLATLTRGLGHDLRGPLQTLTLMADPRAEAFAGAEGERLRGAVSEAVEHLTAAVARFSQVYTTSEAEPAPLVLWEVLEQVSALQRYQRGLPQAEFSLRIGAALPAVRGIEHDLRHLLLSLIVNAKQALQGQAAGRIVLAAEPADGEVRMSVEDNGPGMDEETLRRAFEPFFSTREGGLGIGLPVGRRLAERMGGRLTLEPGDRGGIRAVVTLSEWRPPGAHSAWSGGFAR